MKLSTKTALLGAVTAVQALDIPWIDFQTPPTWSKNDWPTRSAQLTANPPANETYEYIIVGSGAGGAPLAARLAMAGRSVLVIDAGADHGGMREVQVPAMSFYASERSDLTWSFYTRHYEDDEQAKRDRKFTYRTPDGDLYSGLHPPEGSEMLGNYYPRVGGLGGCTQHHALLSIYPHKSDWEYIASVTGDNSWNADLMREKYFKRIENNEYVLPRDPSAHGYDGWLKTCVAPITLIGQDLKVLSMVTAAASALGLDTDGLVHKVTDLIDGLVGGLLGSILPISSITGLLPNLGELLLDDYNNDQPDRDFKTQLAQVPLGMSGTDYTRSTPRDWLYELVNAKNPDGSKKYPIEIALNTLVTKVNFDTTSGDKPKATGVEYLHGESLYRADPRTDATGPNKGTPGSVSASREVIVAGGAFNTPQILKLSGVGPKEELAKFDIPLVKDLPGVGKNLQDRYEVGVTAETEGPIKLIEDCTFNKGGVDDPCYEKWDTGSSGPTKGVYTTSGFAIGLWMKSSQAAEDEPQDIFVGGIPARFQGYFTGYSEQVLLKRNYWSWLVLKAHTRNQGGTVELTSKDPRDTPRITFRNFNEGDPSASENADKDLQAVLEGMRYAERVFDNAIEFDGNFTRVWPTPDVQSDDEMKQWARDEAWGHHASCTCPMGGDDDPMAVLDGQFRVRGVEGLRVVDASAFPKIPGTFPVVAIFMMSEKAADLILGSE